MGKLGEGKGPWRDLGGLTSSSQACRLIVYGFIERGGAKDPHAWKSGDVAGSMRECKEQGKW
jgi:hypothetical protein